MYWWILFSLYPLTGYRINSGNSIVTNNNSNKMKRSINSLLVYTVKVTDGEIGKYRSSISVHFIYALSDILMKQLIIN